MATVTINGQNYTAYADVAQADVYEGASVGPEGVAWRKASTDKKGMGLVSATRMIDRIAWPAGATSTPEWQAAVVNASIELAAALIEGSLTSNQSQAASPIKALGAGSARIEYFRSFDEPAQWPDAFAQIMGPWLSQVSSASGSQGAIAYGTCRPSEFNRDYSTYGN